MTQLQHPHFVATGERLTRPEWLAVRRRGIGSSDAPALLGWSPWESPWTLWLDKSGHLDHLDDEDTEPQEWGRRLEAVIADAVADRTGLALETLHGGIYQHPDHEWMLASPDRLAVDLDGRLQQTGLVEIKTVSAYKADEWKAGEPDATGIVRGGQAPAMYIAQVQHQHAVMGTRWGYLAALLGGNRLVLVEVPRDDEFIALLIDAEAEFWRRVQEADPPPIDGQESTEELLKRLFDEATPGSQTVLDDDILDALTAYHAAAATLKDADTVKRQAANRIRAALGDTEEGIDGDGVRLVTWKEGTRTAVDLDRLKAEFPEVATKVTRTTVTRTLRPSTSKKAKAALGLADME